MAKTEEVPYGFHVVEEESPVTAKQNVYQTTPSKLPEDIPIALTGESVCCPPKERRPIDRLAVGDMINSVDFTLDNGKSLFETIRGLMERKRNAFLRHGNKIFNSVERKRSPKIAAPYEDLWVQITQAHLVQQPVSYLHHKLIPEADVSFAELLTNFRSVTIGNKRIVLHKSAYVFVRDGVGTYRPCLVEKLGTYDPVLVLNGSHTQLNDLDASEVCRVDPTRFPRRHRFSKTLIESFGYHPHAMALTVQVEFGYPFFLSRLLVLPPLPQRYLYNSL